MEYVLDQDEKIKAHLAKKEKIYGTINQNKYYLEQSLSGLDKSGYRTLSPNTRSPLRSPYR